MSTVIPRLRAPKTAKPGEIVEIKTLIDHPMESGHRRDPQGDLVPRDIVNHVIATYNGARVFEADWYPAISAQPYLAFTLRVEAAGDLIVIWTDDHGTRWTQSARIETV